MNHTNELEYTLANGQIVTIHYEAEYEVVDDGIGTYEYWGARGNDIQLNNECQDISVISVDNEEGDDIHDGLSILEKKMVKQAAFDHAEKNAPEVEDCNDEPDPDDQRDYDRDRHYYDS